MCMPEAVLTVPAPIAVRFSVRPPVVVCSPLWSVRVDFMKFYNYINYCPQEKRYGFETWLNERSTPRTRSTLYSHPRCSSIKPDWSIGFILKIPPLVADLWLTRGGIFNNFRTSPKNRRLRRQKPHFWTFQRIWDFQIFLIWDLVNNKGGIFNKGGDF